MLNQQNANYSVSPSYTVINNALIKQSIYTEYLMNAHSEASGPKGYGGADSMGSAAFDSVGSSSGIHHQSRPGATNDDSSDRKLQEISHLKQQNIDFENDIHSLNFSFKNLFRISNLEGFLKLTSLQLDNNNIHKIENISHLKNLRRLDLSFNRIKKIEGLNGLANLENLSLFHNEIVKIENMEHLNNLRCFSIARNQLNDKDNVVYTLRKHHPKLGMLTVFDNPVCQDRLFRYMALAFLDNLQFYDYRMIKDDERQNAKDKYNEKLIALSDIEDREKKKAKRSENDLELNTKYRRANLNGVLDLFDSMFDAIPKELDAFDYCTHETKKNYQEAFDRTVKQFSETMFEKMQEKDDEKNDLYLTMNTEKESNDSEAKRLIKSFERKKKHLFIELKDMTDDDLALDKLNELTDDLDQLANKLIAMEVDQSEAFLDVISQFKENYEIMDNREIISSYFKELRTHEDKYAQEIKDILLDQVSKKDSLEEEIREQVGDFLEDKDQLVGILSRATETRVEILQQKEEELLENEKNGLTETMANVKLEEHRRNRSRISEVVRYADRVREEIFEQKKRFVDVEDGYESFEEDSEEDSNADDNDVDDDDLV